MRERRRAEMGEWQVHVEHPDTDAVFVVQATTEAEALRLGAGRGERAIGVGATATWACERRV